ncbi:MAG: hypothetical protein PHF18_00740 [Methanosarcina sp.]|nr:hypothetical protein [Methanosarcina sp.]MDD3245391.1 hypothetical protein [Methanosarcina sp.]MDD4247594.1 hypothetical protein [Methanosarcina sp.]
MEPLIFGETFSIPDVRTLYDMKKVIADQDWLRTADNFDLHYIQGTCE